MKLQPEPSAVLSQLAQRQQQSSILPTTEPLGISQLHAPQVPTPPGNAAESYHNVFKGVKVCFANSMILEKQLKKLFSLLNIDCY